MTGLTWFDLTVGGLMIISGLLALMRGFTREFTSLIAWGAAAAAAAAAFFTPELTQQAQVYISQEWLAKAAVAGGVFVIVLIILSLISIRFTDWLLDSSPGAFDRTLGFFFGLVRGLALVIIAYAFYIFFMPEPKRFEGVRDAKVLPQLENLLITAADFIPGENGDILKTKTYTYIRQNGAAQPAPQKQSGTGNEKSNPIKQGDKKVLDQLIENTQKTPTNN
jgi:membrane protein required for colicin V production